MEEVEMQEEEKEMVLAPSFPSSPSAMALAGDGTMVETIEDGETKVVHTASRWLGDMAKARKGYISAEEAAREARAMKEILLAKEGVPVDPDDPSKGMRFVDWSNDEDIKKLVEYKRVGVFVPRDVEHEPIFSPKKGEFGEGEGGYVGQFAPGDYILFDPARDIRFPLSDDAPIPLVDEEVELTLRDNAHKIEMFLMNYPLVPIPMYTPRIMPLLHSGIQWPVVMDSFTLFRYQMVMKRILRSRWKFHYDRDVGYMDAAVEVKIRTLITGHTEWTPALPASETGKEEEEDEDAMVEETGPSGKLPTTLEEWWHCLPEWFRAATKTGLEVEEWANTLFTNRLKGKGPSGSRRATIPREDELEGILAEWATQQHQLRNNYIHLKLSDATDERLQYYGYEGRDPAEAAGEVGFLKDLLLITREATAEYLRNNEILLLRMMARHVPVDQWEWFLSDSTLSPMFDRSGEMVTEEEHVKEKTYRDQVRRLRLQTLSGYVPPADETEHIVPRGPTYADMSALWAWYNLHADTEKQYNRALELMAELMPTIPRMSRRVDYTPDPDAMAPLIEKLDIQGVPNSMRDTYLRSSEMDDSTFSSATKGSTIDGLEERVGGEGNRKGEEEIGEIGEKGKGKRKKEN